MKRAKHLITRLFAQKTDNIFPHIFFFLKKIYKIINIYKRIDFKDQYVRNIWKEIIKV